MKICFLAHNLRHDNGGGVFSARSIEAAQAAGATVVALTTLQSGKPYERPLFTGGKFALLGDLWRIRAALKEADIVHPLDTYPYGVIAALAGLGLKKKFIITAVGTGAIAGLYRWPQSWLMRFAYARADTVVAISTFVRDEIQKRIPHLAIKVITHGVEYEQFAAPAPEYVPAAAHRPYIISVGSLRWRKGYKFSIRGFAEIRAQMPSLHYLIVGKRYTEKEFNNLTALITQLGLQDAVTILEQVDSAEDMRALYQGAEAFGLLSQNDDHDVEGFGLVFLEAAAAGLPVVGSSGCGVADAMADGINGYLVPPRDTHAFAQAMLKILQTPGLRGKMADASRAFARDNTWDKKIPQYLALWGLPH